MCQHKRKEVKKELGNNYATVTCMDCGKLIDEKAPADFYLFDNPWERSRIRKPTSGRPAVILPYEFFG